MRFTNRLGNPVLNIGLILQGHLLPAVDFVSQHSDCLFDIALLSTVSPLLSHYNNKCSIQTYQRVTRCFAGSNSQPIFHFLHH